MTIRPAKKTISIIRQIKNPNHNSDGLINCLPPTQDSFVTSPKIYARKLCSIYKILWHPDSFVYRDSIFGLAGRRAGALFFARHRDYFIVTRNLHCHLSGLGTVSQLHRDPKLTRPSTGTGKKHVTATQTAPNQTAGPLGLRDEADSGTANAQKQEFGCAKHLFFYQLMLITSFFVKYDND